MRLNPAAGLILVAIAGIAAGCGKKAALPVEQGMGTSPVIPPPSTSLLPTLNIAPAKGWAEGVTPIPAPGLKVVALAEGLDHPRWLYVLPNGDVLVAETNGPGFPDDSKGIRGLIQNLVQKRAGAKTPSANRITLLRKAADGRVERSVFLAGRHSPFGMALVGNDFYVADTDALWRFPYLPGELTIVGAGEKVLDLPGGPIDHHWTKNVVASADGSKLYVSVGSNSNVAENGIEAEIGRAAIWEVDARTGAHRVFASGLRNPVGMAWQPQTGALWVAVNERDELGSDLVPDYMTAVKDGAFYGWPYSYFGQHVDDRVTPQRPDLVATAAMPDYALGPHTASLGLTFSRAGALPTTFSSGAFVGQHGSWNRKPHSGYKVIFVPFKDGHPSGPAIDVLTAFLDAEGHAQGRPVGVALDKQGNLLVADDVGNKVWQVSGAN